MEASASAFLYHLVPKSVWCEFKSSGKAYFPPTYEKDGFIHLTKDPSFLISIANHFYQGIVGDYVVLCIDEHKLTSKVVYEPAAAVGDTAPAHADNAVLFPHLYGTIDYGSVVHELSVDRAPDGKFLNVQVLP